MFSNFIKRNCSTILVFALVMLFFNAVSAASKDYYQLKVYHLKTKQQQDRVENYLQNAYLPALHRTGIKLVGVFKPVETDTADLKIYVLVPFKSLEMLSSFEQKLNADKQYLADGKDYIDADYKNAPFTRIETVVLQAFPKMTEPAVPTLTSDKAERVYELRSYESPTEKYNVNKVKMFNVGDEVALFKRLNFNAVFYAEVLAGSHMPNLMYMTAFNNKADRDKHWESFTNDPAWKTLTAMTEYKNNVSRNEIVFLHPAAYSDF